MDRKSSRMLWSLVIVFLSAATLITSAGSSFAQPDLCAGFARQYANRNAYPDDLDKALGACPCVTMSTPGATASKSDWSLLYNDAYNKCALDGFVN